MKHLNKILTVVLILTIVFTNVFIPKETALAEEDSNFCLFCDGNEKDAKKEKQFAERIKIIKNIFGDSIDSATLASTVLYLSFEEGVEQYYQEDFDANDFEKQWGDIKNNIESSSENKTDWFGKKDDSDEANDSIIGINADKMDILTSATIVMVLSNGIFGPYDEEKYKEALLLDSGFTNAVIKIGIEPILFEFRVNDIFCNPFSRSIGSIVSAIGGAINNLNPFTENSNYFKYIASMNDICSYGFLEANYSSVKGIKDADKKKLVKENLADKIIEMSKLYNPWFNNEETDCVYQTTSTLAGETTNWRQNQSSSWSSLTLGDDGQTVAEAGSSSVAMAYLIKKSGTAVSTSNFDPSKFVKKVEYSDSVLDWDSISNVAPNFKVAKNKVDVSSHNSKSVASVIEKELNTPSGNNNQTFIILKLTNNWVAVDHVENGTVYVLDPTATSTGLVTLEGALANDGKSSSLKRYKTFYATDVVFIGNKSGETSSNSSPLDYTSVSYKKRLEGLEDYKQCGEKLRDIKLGKSNVCTSGCMVASLAAMYYTFTGTPTNVEALIKDMMKEGEWLDGQAGMGTPYFDKPTNSPLLTKNWGFSGETLNSNDKNEIKNNIISSLKSGKKILLNLGGRKTIYSTVGGHFLMLDHYNESTKEIYIFNPGGSGTGYITENELMTEVLKYNKYGPWAISNSNVNGINNYCDTTGTGSVSDFKELMAFLEGRTSSGCSADQYKSALDPADVVSVGYTTAYGITEKSDADVAKKVGYTNFVSDMQSGCVNKKYIELMIEELAKEYYDAVKQIASKYNLTLSENEIYAFASFYHNTPSSATDAIKKLATGNLKKTDYEYWNYWHSHGGPGVGTWTSTADDGLIRRRLVEYEILLTGNFNADKTSFTYAKLHSMIYNQKTLEDYKSKYWPTNRNK